MLGFEVVKALRDRGIVVSGTLAFLICVLVQRAKLHQYDAAIVDIRTPDDTQVTRLFLKDFFHVARLALPTVWCKEFFGTLVFVTLFLLKSILHVAQFNANGHLLQAIVGGTAEDQVKRFFNALLLRAAVSMMCAVCSSSVEHLRPWLVACFRERLSHLFQRRFYSRLIYYQANVLDTRLEAADTAIATYSAEFAEHFAELPYYFILPFFECAASMVALTRQVGGKAAAMASVVVAISVLVLQQLSPAFGRIHALLLSREDSYRRMLTTSLNNVEPIALHNGGRYTRRQLDKQLGKLKRALDQFALAKGHFELLEISFSSFLQAISGVVIFRGVQQKKMKEMSDVYVTMQYMQDLIENVKSFVVNFREISHLSTFTTKLAEFDTTLTSIAQGCFVRSRNASSESGSGPQSPTDYTGVNYIVRPVGVKEFTLFSFNHVKLTTPVGRPLYNDLDLEIRSDQDWVLLGENGCGKTSLLRMISGLWPPTAGKYSMEQSVRLLFAPQYSYMVPQCTLLEQVRFPRIESTVSAKELVAFKEALRLSGARSVIELLGGLESSYIGLDPRTADETYDWDSLSGGQKQRISMARVFYRVLTMDRSQETPVALLDESTSMMDETEQEVLRNLRRLNVRMVSVTHREEVIMHHTHALQVQPGGRWTATRVATHVDIGHNS
ncbi:ATP-binding cassette protein subfamily D, member 1 [Trypanosoma rangeli]|uniref:ATP-binding cassette protein subfamily D, member 1 n=1 Tax=Trypanosoma rangeli TaxID=5698 RepID=A0A422NTH3_TRYRA|nr:ATP-binding cassette protein subfamily D, member 1 [Trypanosoma rangeli]RNF08729.1 ATP-binding cassette protein subfamily D, member 1 [Trypanosoma rangeli]|eukprot:RNF08729.1 ATP-binding cassette protein subfamily D, member 1 [Trypanosoma rangeli]